MIVLVVVCLLLRLTEFNTAVYKALELGIVTR